MNSTESRQGAAVPRGCAFEDLFSGVRIYALGFMMILVYLSPLLIKGQDAHVLINDNLDGYIAQFKVLAESGMMFAPGSAEVPNLFGGIPRNALGSEFNVTLWLFRFLSPFESYVVNQLLMRVVAFFGAFLLLRLWLNPRCALLPFFLSIGFALLPFWPAGGLSIAGQPMLAYCFLRLIQPGDGPRVRYVLYIAAFPFYSFLFFSGIFILLILAIICLRDLVSVNRKLQPRLVLGTTVLALAYAIVEYRMIGGTLFGWGFVSSRTAMVYGHWPWLAAIWMSMGIFLHGEPHSDSLAFPVVHMAWALALVIGAAARKSPGKLFWVSLTFLVSVSLFYGMYSSDWFAREIKSNVTFLQQFQFQRLYTLFPLCFLILFASSVRFLHQRGGAPKVVGWILVTAQILVAYSQNDEFRYRNGPTYREFFSSSAFAMVKAAISADPSTYRVACLGIHPAIAQYNGFYTVGGYLSIYPLEKKRAFRRVIKRELEKSPGLRRYYDHWGNRMYLLSSELTNNFFFDKRSKVGVRDLEIDSGALYDLGARYLISAVPIVNYADNHLVRVGIAQTDDSGLRLFVYRIAPDPK